jgi:hypothetical protein
MYFFRACFHIALTAHTGLHDNTSNNDSTELISAILSTKLLGACLHDTIAL